MRDHQLRELNRLKSITLFVSQLAHLRSAIIRRTESAFRLILTIAIVVVFSFTLCLRSSAQEVRLQAIVDQVLSLYAQGKYAEAVPLAQKYADGTKAYYGPEHPEYAVALNNLALMLQNTNQFAQAEQLYTLSMSIREKSLGKNDVMVAESLNNIATLYKEMGRDREAEPLLRRAIAINEKQLGADDPSVATGLHNLAVILVDANHLEEAETALTRAILIYERAEGPDAASVALSVSSLGQAYLAQGRYEEAERLLQRALAISQARLGPDHPHLATALANYAAVMEKTLKFGDAELLYRRALAISEKAHGPNHPNYANNLNSLGMFLYNTRPNEAEPLLRRAVSISEKALGPNHPDVSIQLNNLALILEATNRNGEAEPLLRSALAIREKNLGQDHPMVANGLMNLGQLLEATNRQAEAELLFRRSLAISEKVLRPDHPDVANAANNLAHVLQSLGKGAEAELLYRRALGNNEKNGLKNPQTLNLLINLAILMAEKGDWQAAQVYYEWAKPLILDERVNFQDRSGLSSILVTGNSGVYRSYARALFRVGAGDPQLREEGFAMAQRALATRASQALSQMAARQSKSKGSFATLIRQREELTAERQSTDKRLLSAIGSGDLPLVANLRANLGKLDAKLDQIEKKLGADFKDYSSLANPQPVTMPEVQGLLRDDEALVVFLDVPKVMKLPEEGIVWVVTKTTARWARIDLGTTALAGQVAALRCGLDPAAWRGDGKKRCGTALGIDPSHQINSGTDLPFDLSRAHKLYESLFGEIEDLIANKHLLIVPTGALTSLPFQVLVTKDTKSTFDLDGYSNAAWLGRAHALTVLPSVNSLATLRRNSKPSAAKEPFIGYGNPVLAGNERCSKITIPDKCPDEELQVAAAKPQLARSLPVDEAVPSFYRNGLADVAEVRKLCPLPDTAYELKCVAQSLGSPLTTINLGKDMTETALKKAPLYRYRVIHFATHGLLAGDTAKLANARAEPALVMSPPDNPTEEDDGLLTASEIAGLKLDADWVVMSACNTAAGSEPGSEALSGLARAFFYAGARALLVSHWPVNSYAATTLTSRTFFEMRKDATIGRSEALRRAMFALASDPGRPWAAHPSVWAPFVVVGEGAVAAK